MRFESVRKSLANYIYPNRTMAGGYRRNVHIEKPSLNEIFNTSVATCVRILSMICSQAEFTSRIKWANKILVKPNSIQHSQSFLQSIVIDLLEYGVAAIYAPRTGKMNQREELIPLPAKDVQITSSNKRLALVTYAREGINRDEVMFVFDGLRSDGTVRSRVWDAADRVLQLSEIDLRSVEILINSYRQTQYLTTQQKSVGNIEEVQRMLKGVDEEGKQVNRSLILGNGTEIKEVKPVIPVDSPTATQREALKREIAAAFALPGEVIGTAGNEKYSNAQIRNQVIHSLAVFPILLNIQKTLEAELAVELDLDMTPIYQGDLSTMIDAATALAGGPVGTVNEGRKIAGYTPLDGDEYNKVRAGQDPNRDPRTNAAGDRRGENTSDGNDDE